MKWNDILMLRYLILFLIIINLIGFIIVGVDKVKANKKAWRIPEKTLLSLAVLGGSAGLWIGMYFFRHKTRKLKFTLGIPLIIILQALLAVWGLE